MSVDIKLFNKDALEVLKSIDSESIDFVCTDPPYCINYKDWDVKNFTKFTSNWLTQVYRVLKPTGSMWSFMGKENILDFIPLCRQIGFSVNLDNWVIWARQKGRSSSKHLKSSREDIIHCTKGKVFTWNDIKLLRDVIAPYKEDGKPKGWFINEEGRRVRWTGLGNVWVYTAPVWSSKIEPPIHPTQKPEMMIERLLQLSSNENDLVLDPFMGSGTCGVVAKRMKRNFIGVELNEEYFNKAIARIGN